MAFHVFERVGFRAFLTRLIWLHMRYGPRVALSTLNPCRYLHESKARFPVGWLGPCRGGNYTRWKRRALPGAPKQARMSPSKIHCGECFRAKTLKHCLMASAVERCVRKP
jgi:hypothetical protein